MDSDSSFKLLLSMLVGVALGFGLASSLTDPVKPQSIPAKVFKVTCISENGGRRIVYWYDDQTQTTSDLMYGSCPQPGW